MCLHNTYVLNIYFIPISMFMLCGISDWSLPRYLLILNFLYPVLYFSSNVIVLLYRSIRFIYSTMIKVTFYFLKVALYWLIRHIRVNITILYCVSVKIVLKIELKENQNYLIITSCSNIFFCQFLCYVFTFWNIWIIYYISSESLLVRKERGITPSSEISSLAQIESL